MGDSDGFRLDDLSGLKDVSLSGIADGNILVYVAATGTWQNRATLPATAGVDSITNTDGSLTISPTTGAVVAGLNVEHANVWSAQQTFNSGAIFGAGLTVSAGVITFDTVPQASQGGSDTNTGYGTFSLNANIGTNNSSYGYYTANANTVGSGNCAFGYQVLMNNTTGFFNLGVGYLTFNNYNNTTSTNGYLVGLGYHAGINYTGSEVRNIVVGYNLGVEGESDMLRIGNPGFGPGYGQIAFSMLGLVGTGVPAIYGNDIRVGVTAPDASAITLYTVTLTTNRIFEIGGSLTTTAFTSGSIVYTITWTDDNGTAHTLSATSSGVGHLDISSVTVRVKANTAITAQITGTFVATVEPVAIAKAVA